MSTLRRMPTFARIEAAASNFTAAAVRFFGAASYLMPLLARVIGDEKASKFSDTIDRLVNVHCSAFKFVMVVTGKR